MSLDGSPEHSHPIDMAPRSDRFFRPQNGLVGEHSHGGRHEPRTDAFFALRPIPNGNTRSASDVKLRVRVPALPEEVSNHAQ